MKNLKKIDWKRLFLDNWVLKLGSLTVAFALWFVVVTIDDPIEDKTFYNIKVDILNTKKLTDAGMVVEVLEGTDILRSVSFEAPKSVRDMITEDDIIAEANLDNLTLNNTVEIEISCPKYSSDVTKLEGSVEFVKLNIEEKIYKWINIEERIVGEVAEGYLIGNVTLDRNRLELEGPASKVKEIDRAVVDVNIAEIKDDISTTVDVYFLDKEGRNLNAGSVKHNVSTVTAKVDVLKVKEIPVVYSPVGAVAEGYLTTGVIDGTPDTILVAGNSPTIDELNGITVTDELDLTDVTEDLVKEINLRNYLPGGIILADEAFGGKANVTVYVEEEVVKEIQLKRNNLQIVGAPDHLMAQVLVEQEMPILRVSGLQENMTSLNETRLAGQVDVAEWMNRNQIEDIVPGIHILPVSFQLAEGQNIEETVYVQVQFSLVEEENELRIRE